MFEELDQEEYDERQLARREDDFIVDDEGFGYKDRGGEIWEVGETTAGDAAKKKKRKLNVSRFETKLNLMAVCWSRKMSKPFMGLCSQRAVLSRTKGKWLCLSTKSQELKWMRRRPKTSWANFSTSLMRTMLIS